MFSYYLKEGGVWRQNNADHEAGDDKPVAFIKRYRWGPGGTTVLDDTYALMEDGACLPWAHNIFNWDHGERSIGGQVFDSTGVWCSGLITKTGDHKTTAEFVGFMPDGSETRMRDTTDRSNPHEAVDTASISDGKTWKRGDSVSWVQVTSGVEPCA